MKKKFIFGLLSTSCLISNLSADISIEEEGEYSATTTILLSEDAQDRNNINLVDRLKEDISYNQVTGDIGAPSISFRGLDYRATSFSEDLIPLFKTTTQNPTTSNIFNTNDEIISNGAKSPSLFGVSSIGGDFEIKTSVPKKEFEGGLNTTFSKNTIFNSLMLNSRQKDFYIKSNFIYYDRDSFDLSDDFQTTAFQTTKTRSNSDKENKAANIKLGYFLDDRDEIAFKYSNSKSEYGNEPQIHGDNWYDYTRVEFQDIQSFYGYFNRKDKDYNLYLRSYFDKYKDLWKIYNDATYTTLRKQPVVYDDERVGLLSKLELKKEKSTLGFVVNYEENKHITKRVEWAPSTPTYKYQKILTSLLYKQNFEKLTIDSALTYKKYRPLKIDYDGHNFSFPESGSKNSLVDAQVSMNYKISEENTIFASLSKSSKIPSMMEMFAFSDYIEPNPNLKAEKANNIELGFTHSSIIGFLTASIYNYDLEDKIQRINNKYINIKEATHRGFEVKYLNQYKKNLFNIAYSYSKTEDDNNKKLDLIPTHKFMISDKIDISRKLSAIIEATYQSKMYKNKEADLIKPYTLFNFHTTYKLKKNIKTVLSIKNIFDKNYEHDYGMPSPGREYFVSLNWKF